MLAVDGTDWGRLFHAYGVATDTPRELRNLTASDGGLRGQAIDHLFSAILHQGTIYPATPPAVRVVVTLLGEPSLRDPLAKGGSALGSALAFLAEVARSLADIGPIDPPPLPAEADVAELFRQFHAEDEEEDWGSEVIGALMARAVVDLRAMAGDMLVAVTPFLVDEAADVRCHAIDALSQWGAIEPDGGAARIAIGVIEDRLVQVDDRDEGAGLILALGLFGHDLSARLDDPDEAVRTCAALFVDDPKAVAQLITALTDPANVNGWFVHRPSYFTVHVRFRLVAELIARQVTIETMLPAAVALIAGASAMTADFEWGRILQLAFPEQVEAFKPGQRPPLPAQLTDAQRAVLEALVANAALWQPGNGNASLARMRVGLSDDRGAVAEYCRSAPPVRAG